MEAQFELDHVPAGPRQLTGYKLFLALFPNMDDVPRLERLAAGLRLDQGLEGNCLAPDRLHVTLQTIANFPDAVPQIYVDAARAAAARVDGPPIPVVFDHVMSYAQSEAFVLRCNAESDVRIAALRQSMHTALRRAGLRPHQTRQPHMTLLYDRNLIAQRPIEPFQWTATRVVFVISHVGLHHHQWVAQWALAK